MDSGSLWYKDAIIYEVHVRAFADSDADGVGDFAGLTSKLDYLADLGITAIWLLPFYPSPLKDDGYDIADYTTIHPAYGTMEDFRAFLDAAHERGLRVITELVINHTSDTHAWFQRARRAPPGSPERDMYVWSDTPEKYQGARIIFKDFEVSNWTWDPIAKAYYWHRFYAHQPDLNFASPFVRAAVTEVMDAWFDMGVDGLRLDAIPYLFEREGTSCENLPETHDVLREMRAHVDARHKDKMLLAEANQWPEDAIAYFGKGDECHMSFHFPLMPRLFMSLRMEDSYPIIDILRQTPPIPETCQWATFLRNHDELTLEMVTDEERDYMYRVYAGDPQMRINLGIRRRLAPLLGNHRGMIELMNVLLFSLPGAPVLYYGDEIGMGDNIYLPDRNGVRTPMQWSADRNAGFSRANPQKLYLPVIIDPEYHYEARNVDAEEQSSHSLLWWTRRLLALRKRFPALSRGTVEFLTPDNRKVLAFLRQYEDQTLLIVVNLSRFPQSAGLDLSALRGRTPIEVFGLSSFPLIGEGPYTVTLGPYGYYWFHLPDSAGERASREHPILPTLSVVHRPERILEEDHRGPLESVLPAYLRWRPWFLGKRKTIRHVEIEEVVPLASARLAILTVEYADADPETYLLPIALAEGEAASRILEALPHAVFTRVHLSDRGGDFLAYDAFYDPSFQRELLELFARKTVSRSETFTLAPLSRSALPELLAHQPTLLEPSIEPRENQRAIIDYSHQLDLEVYRNLQVGPHPEVELGRALEGEGEHVVPYLGHLELIRRRKGSMVLAVLSKHVESQGTGWAFTIDAIGRFFAAAFAAPASPQPLPPLLALLGLPMGDDAAELIGPYAQQIGLLGSRIAELHIALASRVPDPSFAPEPYNEFSRRSLYHSLVGLADRTQRLLIRRVHHLSPESQALAAEVIRRAPELRAKLDALRAIPFRALRIRTHGDLDLSKVLFTGKDWSLGSFGGDPSRPLSERRLKRSALRDVAGMLRSFHYASFAASYGDVPGVVTRPRDLPAWGAYWRGWVSRAFLLGYLDRAHGEGLFSEDRAELGALLDALLLEKTFREIEVEIDERPPWVRIPLSGILELLVAQTPP